jgi:hypothetical protein
MTLNVRVHFSAIQDVELQTERNGVDWAGRHMVSVEKCTVLPSFVFTNKLLRHLKVLILALRVNPHRYIVTCMSDYRRGLDWCMGLLTTYRS